MRANSTPAQSFDRYHHLSFNSVCIHLRAAYSMDGTVRSHTPINAKGQEKLPCFVPSGKRADTCNIHLSRRQLDFHPKEWKLYCTSNIQIQYPLLRIEVLVEDLLSSGFVVFWYDAKTRIFIASSSMVDMRSTLACYSSLTSRHVI